MARYQYQINGTLDWASNSGNALLALANPSGSGKKLVIKRFETTPLSMMGSGAPVANISQLVLKRGVVSGGTSIVPTKLDSDAAAWPSTVALLLGAAYASVEAGAIRRIEPLKQMNSFNALIDMSRQGHRAQLNKAFVSPRDTAVEEVVVRANESLLLIAEPMGYNAPLRIDANFIREGSPNRSYSINALVPPYGNGAAIFAIENQSGSGEVIRLTSLSVEEVGGLTTPYLQLVPIGSVDPTSTTDPTREVPIMKMDSANPSPTSWIKAYQDVAVLPFGLPENAFADSSAGSPRGFNYLKTKDFVGPVLRTFFPEVAGLRGTFSTGIPENFGTNSQRQGDLLTRFSGITIRPGETIGLVSSAETAAGATAAVDLSGWAQFWISAVIDVEPEREPTLTLTGLKPDTEVRIFVAGTGTELAGQEDIDTGSFSWLFDPEATPSVDISILSLGYQNTRLLGVALSLADLTIPIQQQVDRQYNNP